MKKGLALLLAGAMMAATVAGCGASDSSSSSSSAASDTTSESTAASETSSDGKTVIKVGVPLPLSGSSQEVGLLAKVGIEGAYEYFMEHGGFVNHPDYEVEFIFEDIESDNNVAVTQTEKLVSQDDVDVLLGGCFSGYCSAINPIAIKYEIPYMQSYGSANSLTETENEWSYRTVPSDQQQASTIKAFIEYLNGIDEIKTYAWVGSNEESAQSARTVFANIAESLGIECVVDENVEQGIADMSGVVQKIKSAEPDVIFSMFQVNECLLFHRQLAEYGVNIPVIARGSGYLTTGFLESSGSTGENVISSTHYANMTSQFLTEEGQEWNEKLEEAAGIQITEATTGSWTATAVLLQALDSTDDLSNTGIRDAIQATDLPGDNWALLFNNWYGGIRYDDFETDGVMQYNQNVYATCQLAQVHDGTYWPVFPLDIFEDVADDPLVYPLPEQ